MTNQREFKVLKKGVVENRAVIINEVANDTTHFEGEEMYDIDVKVHRRQTERELVKLARDILDYFKASYINRHYRNVKREWYLKNKPKCVARDKAWRIANKALYNAHRRKYYRLHADEINRRRREKRAKLQKS